MKLARAPNTLAIRPFVAQLWASDGTETAPAASGRELVLPTGAMHIVIRLGAQPLRLFVDPADPVGHAVGCAVIGGARAGPYLKDTTAPAATVGALLRPGAGALVLGAPADALSEAHTPLDDVWPPAAVAELCARLNEARSPAERLDLFEAALASRLPRVRGMDPLVAHALSRFRTAGSVAQVVRECGYSHRHFSRLFSEAVGLGPKTYCRVSRFARLVDRLAEQPGAPWADLAAAEGYADQAHLSREFRRLAALSPGRYRRLAPVLAHHVPL